MRLPPALDWTRDDEQGRAWVATLPGVLAACAERWDLTLGEPFPTSFVSLTLPAGDALVLKVQFPHRECEEEAAALAAWNGDGAVRLVAHDPERHALLLERCLPGTSLPPAVALDVLVPLLPRLWKPAGPASPFRPLAAEAVDWAAGLERAWNEAGRPCERVLIDAALAALRELPGTQGEQVLLHQDLHPANVLAAAREPWLVIDPKPLAGEREMGLAPLIRAHDLGHDRRAVLYRLDRLTAELGLDRERARRWTLAQTMAWSFSGSHLADHHQTARWIL